MTTPKMCETCGEYPACVKSVKWPNLCRWCGAYKAELEYHARQKAKRKAEREKREAGLTAEQFVTLRYPMARIDSYQCGVHGRYRVITGDCWPKNYLTVHQLWNTSHGEAWDDARRAILRNRKKYRKWEKR